MTTPASRRTGVRSPGVKRQYSGTLGKIGNCQIGVSLHAVGERGTLPLGWSLYLPEDWCDDRERRGGRRSPTTLRFQTKPQLALALIRKAAEWDVPSGPILGDQAYGDDGAFRVGLDEERLSYVLAVTETTSVYGPDTEFVVPERAGAIGRTPHVGRADRPACSLGTLARTLPADAFETLAFAEAPDGTTRAGRFACVRVYAASEILADDASRAPSGSIIEWPDGADAPTDYWLSNLPAGTPPTELARASPGCAGRSSSTTASSKASSASTTTKAAPSPAGTTTPRS